LGLDIYGNPEEIQKNGISISLKVLAKLKRISFALK